MPMDASEIEQRVAAMAERARARRTDAPPEPEPEPTPTPPATRNVVPFRPRRDASVPRLDRIANAEARELPGFPDAAGNAPADPTQLDLPELGPVISGCPSWLLWIYDPRGGRLPRPRPRRAPGPCVCSSEPSYTFRSPIATANGAPFGSPPPRPSRGSIREAGPTGAATGNASLAPSTRCANASRTFPCQASDPSRSCSRASFREQRRNPFVEFTIRIPTAAARGASIDWPRLCVYGTRSAALYRAYLSVSALPRPIGSPRPPHHCADRSAKARQGRTAATPQRWCPSPKPHRDHLETPPHVTSSRSRIPISARMIGT